MSRSALLPGLALCAALPLSAWGRQGHEIVAALACRDLPPALAPWFQGREQVLRDHVNDPDAWKQADPKEGPRHFLDSEAYGGPAAVPRAIQDAASRLGPEAFARNGQVPWTIQDRVQLLAAAFQTGDPDQVAFQAAILCHYVGDLNVPLHTTANHDGQFTGQHGVHHRWETGLVERLGDWQPEVRTAEPEPEAEFAPWRWLQQSFALVAPLLRDDLEAHGPSPREVQEAARTSYDWTEFNRLEGPVVREQLNRAGQRTAEMILLAWTRAGQPRAGLGADQARLRTGMASWRGIRLASSCGVFGTITVITPSFRVAQVWSGQDPAGRLKEREKRPKVRSRA